MNILGLHFGHDGAVAVLKEGRLAAFVMRERQASVKHAMGVTDRELQLALREAGIRFTDVDAVSVTSTQGVELMTGLIPGLLLRYGRHSEDNIRSSVEAILSARDKPIEPSLSFHLRELFGNRKYDDTVAYQAYASCCIESEKIRQGKIATLGCLDDFVAHDFWTTGCTLPSLAQTKLSLLLQLADLEYGFHYPMIATLDGHSVPATLFSITWPILPLPTFAPASQTRPSSATTAVVQVRNITVA